MLGVAWDWSDPLVTMPWLTLSVASVATTKLSCSFIDFDLHHSQGTQHSLYSMMTPGRSHVSVQIQAWKVESIGLI